MSIHHGISCDLCRKINFSHRRYKCLLCHDFDLCSICFDNRLNVSFQTHSIHHSMQLILTANDYEHIYFGQKRISHSPLSLTCSFCNQNGFSLDNLIQHINEIHSTANHFVLCPICFTRQNHLVRHLREHTEENIISKNKQMKTLNRTNEKSLLEQFICNYSNENQTNQRYSFIHALLTDLLNQKSFDKYAENKSILKSQFIQ
ncbi:hypothetical protein I4U23_025691 [Adineta vaga]|nr:hypothetical protein I4U23_025691 [Adineta vaga]